MFKIALKNIHWYKLQMLSNFGIVSFYGKYDDCVDKVKRLEEKK